MAEATTEGLQHAVPDSAKFRALRPVLIYYAIARDGTNGLRLLHVPFGFGEEALVMFSSREAAQNFILAAVFLGEWHARECSAGELVSLLLGPYEGIEWVLLDPLPRGNLAGERAQANLLNREQFVEHLLG